MKSNKLFALLSIVVIAAIALTACGAPATTAAPAATQPPAAATQAPAATAVPEQPTAVPEPKTITIGFQQEPTALYPKCSNMTFAVWVGQLTNPGLWTWDGNNQPIMELAESMPNTADGSISADGLTYTYKLKPGLKWNDGEPLTSADIKFTWETIMDPANTCIVDRLGFELIESIETPDDVTAVVKFTEFYAPWNNLFAMSGNSGTGLLPQHVLEGQILDNNDFLRQPITAGAYYVESWVQGDLITLQANDNYVRGRPKIDTIFIKMVPSREALLAALQTGDVDLGPDFVEASIPDLENTPGVSAIAITGSSFEHYLFNLDQDPAVGFCPFQDVRVRKAMILGIDRYTTADTLLFGKTRVVSNLWPNTPVENTDLEPYPFDPDQAKALLDEAGYTDTDGDGIREGECNGDTVILSFTHQTTTPNQLRADVQALAAQNLLDIGIELIPDNKSPDILFAGFAGDGPLATGNFVLAGYTTSFIPDPDPLGSFDCNQIPTTESPDGANWYRMCFPELDAMMAEQKSIADPAARAEIFKDAQQFMYDNALFIPMYARLNVLGVGSRLTGLQGSAFGDVYWNVYDWDVNP
ncbi:MAG TPA: peptide ABC transporter substrate-binding protein [Anaerolineales bacterium]|nr:peptide ABC transporter substrate-binding protein [Anaerolineales bacterium]